MSRRIACWMSDKKIQKINWGEFENTCRENGYSLFKLDLHKSLESQAPFCVVVHKLTDIIASAEQGNDKSREIVQMVENYLSSHPSIMVLDPIPNVRQLLNRYISYRIINSTNLYKYEIFTPNFCELKSNNVQEISNQLKNAGVTYPFIVKPPLGHGSKKAHEMSIIFNERGLKDCRSPCVAQSFIKHNAILYKIFIVGDKFHVVERPSLKNFEACSDDTIHFDSSAVSKPGSVNDLTVLEPHEKVYTSKLDYDIFRRIAFTLRVAFDMDLLGVDVVVENSTGKYAIVDINAFPGYDGFPDFFKALLEWIEVKVNARCSKTLINGKK